MYTQDPNCSLKNVNLAYNDFGPEGTETLSNALQVTSNTLLINCFSVPDPSLPVQHYGVCVVYGWVQDGPCGGHPGGSHAAGQPHHTAAESCQHRPGH